VSPQQKLLVLNPVHVFVDRRTDFSDLHDSAVHLHTPWLPERLLSCAVIRNSPEVSRNAKYFPASSPETFFILVNQIWRTTQRRS